MKDAAELWDLAVKNIPPNHEYILKNGKYYSSISELKDFGLENKVAQKVKKQIGKNDSKGVVFNSKSTLADVIYHLSNYKAYYFICFI